LEKRDRCLPLWRDVQDRFEAGFGREPSRALRASLMAIVGQPHATPSKFIERR